MKLAAVVVLAYTVAAVQLARTFDWYARRFWDSVQGEYDHLRSGLPR